MKKLIVILCCIATISAFGQDYGWKSKVQKTDSTGFCKINLQPDIVAKLNSNFADIRIRDKNGKEIPYFIEKEDFSVTKRVFREYKLVEKIKWTNGATVLFIENEAKDTINNIQLQIKNFDVRKHLELAGSDNYKDWYTIKENYLFYSADGGITTSEMKSMNFPYCDYKYYRIIIYDCYSLPINVMKIGYYDTYREQGKFKQLAAPVLSRTDSNETRETYIKVNFKETPYFDKLVFKVGKPDYFYRNARICLRHHDKKGRVYYEPIAYFDLNSNNDLTFYRSDFPYQEFYVVIANEDNPPLENIEIDGYQLNRYLVSYLEASNDYQLVFENEKIKNKPNYDIGFFKNKIANNVVHLSTETIQPIKHNLKTEEETSVYWIWIAIGLVVLLLGYVSYKMILEMEKK